MAIARFKDVCLDAGDVTGFGQFWAAVLGRTWKLQEDGDGVLTGPTPGHTIWINGVPEPKPVKNRVHLDIYARSLTGLQALGATVVEPFPRWTVMADPEGGEFCAFLRPEIPAERLHGLVIDCADPGRARHADPGDGLLPESKAAKNRVHWDVTAHDPATYLACPFFPGSSAGASCSWGAVVTGGGGVVPPGAVAGRACCGRPCQGAPCQGAPCQGAAAVPVPFAVAARAASA